MVLALGLLPAGGAADTTSTSDVKHYNVVLAGSQTQDGFDAVGSAAAVRTLIASADGTVVNDMTAQIGVLTVASANELFAEALRASSLVVDAGEDYA